MLDAVGVDLPDEPDCDAVVAPLWHGIGGEQASWGCDESGGEPLTVVNALLGPFRGLMAISVL